MKSFIKKLIPLYVIAIALTLIWQGLELLIYKEIRPDAVDTIIAIIFTFILRDYIRLRYKYR